MKGFPLMPLLYFYDVEWISLSAESIISMLLIYT